MLNTIIEVARRKIDIVYQLYVVFLNNWMMECNGSNEGGMPILLHLAPGYKEEEK